MDAPAESLAGQLWTANRHNDVLRQALAAAEAECAAARLALKREPYNPNGLEAFVKAFDANDATRARLGLGRIGEVGK